MNKVKHYKRKKNVIPQRVEATVESGLTSAQVEERKMMGFDNPATNQKSTTYLGIIFSEIFTYFNLIFFIIAIILICFGAYTQLTFLVIVLANLLIGIIQKIKSKRIIDKLSLVSASTVDVIRDGKEQNILTTDLVLDDIFRLSSGQQISCDGIVLSGEIRVNESLLTGESLPIVKKAGDVVLSGSFVISGNAYVRADKVGADTFVVGLTSQAKKYKKPNSVILNTLNTIIKFIGIIIIPIAVILFFRTYYAGDHDIYNTVIKTSGAVIGMIPSGLFLLTSTALVVGVMRLAGKKTLVQDLYCIEMLARVNVMCFDKTGTITDGSMVFKELTVLNKPDRKEKFYEIIQSMQFALEDDNDTAKALQKEFVPKEIIKATKHFNFSSENKFSCVYFKGKGSYFLGAPEMMLDKAKNQKAFQIINENAGKGYRVLALCHSEQEYDGKNKPTDIRALALVVLEDNVRQDAIETIKYFNENNVNLKVISGDNALTVSEVAKRAGIIGAEKYVSLEGMSDQDVIKIANDYTVFGRVVPHQKKLLVQAMKKAGNTVAMMGDGVNDILALKEADCSIAVGAGADAARRVSQLILTDSNFCSMQDVVAEGRRVTNNIRTASPLFLTKTMFSVCFSIFCIIMGFEYAFSPVQLLLMEMFAIGLPAFALALQPNRELIKGKFLQTILAKSVIGAVVSLFIAMFLYLTPNITGLSQAEIQSIIVVAITINALFVIGRVSWPFNAYRLFVLVTMAMLVIVGFFTFSNLYGTSLFAGTPLFNLLQIDQLSENGYNWLYISLASIPVLLAIGMTIEWGVKKLYANRKKRKIPLNNEGY